MKSVTNPRTTNDCGEYQFSGVCPFDQAITQDTSDANSLGFDFIFKKPHGERRSNVNAKSEEAGVRVFSQEVQIVSTMTTAIIFHANWGISCLCVGQLKFLKFSNCGPEVFTSDDSLKLWHIFLRSCRGSVDTTTDSQPWGLRFESAGTAVVPLGEALHCLRKDLKPLVPWLLAYKQLAFLVAR